MTVKEKNTEILDEAWDHLLSRLQGDGLLTDNKETGSSKNIPRSTTLRWVAGIAILCICSTIAFMFYKSEVSPTREILTLENTDNKVNLVTTLEDGSVVYLADQTSLSFPKHFDDDKREVYLRGDAFFDIQKNAKKPFVIETNLIKIEVLGTSFDVKCKDSTPFSLSVLKGEVRITLKETGNSSHIKAGETVLLRKTNLEKTSTSDFNIFTDYANKIYFKDERLADIVKVINKNSEDLKIELSPALNNRLLTVAFMGENVPDMAQLISLALNLECRRAENTILISEPRHIP